MPGTYSQLLYHLVFSTKHRTPWITPDIAVRLYPYLGGILRAEKAALYAVGGMPDHLHLYIQYRTDDALSHLLRTLKTRSSLWIHQTFPSLPDFAWQEGYSAFTVSKSQEPAVKNYLAHQAQHHRQTDFKSELLDLLRRHGIEFDERYLFD